MPLRLLEVDSATDHQNHVFRLCGDPTVTALPPAPGTPEHLVGYSEVENEISSPSAFQRGIAHTFVAIGSSGWNSLDFLSEVK